MLNSGGSAPDSHSGLINVRLARIAPPDAITDSVYTAACTRTNRLEHEAQSPA